MQLYIDPYCRSTLQDGREATTQTSYLYLKALLTCVENKSWNLSLTRNTELWHIHHHSEDLRKTDRNDYSAALNTKFIEVY